MKMHDLKSAAATQKIIPSGLPLPIAKVCGCGFKTLRTNDDTIVCSQGHLWFNCPCGSTKVFLKGKHAF